jgi:protocatechuate 3,4-dioxygenase beta subunit
MGNRWFASSELSAFRRRRAALRQLISRRDALAWLATTSAPLVACAGRDANDLAPRFAHEPYEFSAAGGQDSAGPATGGATFESGTGGVPLNAASGAGGSAGADGTGDACLAADGACAQTADNILGPFYKEGAPFRSDLTSGVSVSKVLEVRGRVVGCDCETPLADAIVDIWQADESGAYDNTGYLLRGRMLTDTDGQYLYSSVLPGAYLNGSQYRPKHIHYKVTHPSASGLVTQLYFQGDPYIPQDPFVKDALVMPLSEDSGIYRVTFDIVLP